jgi:multidrug efflux pump subunit AcrB
MARATTTGTRGQQLPNLEAPGLAKKMKPAAKLIDEQDQIRQRARVLGSERQELEEQIKRLERERTQEWARSIRSGEEAPSEEAIEKARERLESVRKEIAAVRRAGEIGESELHQTVAENSTEWDVEVQAKGEKILSEAQEIADALSRKLAETDALVGVHSWLQSSGQSYTPASPSSISIEHLLHERRRELGLMDVGVVG